MICLIRLKIYPPALGAIKFGDDLSLRECEDLIVSLRECQLPFQCAHGRPSIMPVLDTTQLGKQSEVRGCNSHQMQNSG